MIQALYHYLVYDFQRFQADREISKWEAKRAKDVAVATSEGKTLAELEEIKRSWHWDLQQYYDLKDLVITKHWLRRARKYDLKQPRYDDENMWHDSRWFYERTLSDDGIEMIRKAWREEIAWRVTTFSGVIGLLVAVGGLVVAILSLAK